MNRFRKPPPTSPDDPRLVELVVSLGQQLDIPKLDVREVRWRNIVPAGRTSVPIPSDWCFFLRHTIVMPVRMMGKLTLEEWRPLIASSVLFQKKLRKSTDRIWWLYVLLPMFLVLVASIAIVAILSIYWISLIFILLVFPVLIIGNRHYRPYLKKASLEADTKTSPLTGKESFLDVLRKIDTIGRGDAEISKTDKRSHSSLGLPTLEERIDNIQGIPSTGSKEAS